MDEPEIPRGMSDTEAQLYRHLVTHVAFEAGLATKYDELTSSPTAYVAFLAALVADDERRHHQLYELWAEELRGMAELQNTGLPALEREEDPAGLIAATETLLEFERRDIDHLKDLAKSIKDMRDTTLWGLVIDIMRADTEKHITILTFIRDHAKATLKQR